MEEEDVILGLNLEMPSVIAGDRTDAFEAAMEAAQLEGTASAGDNSEAASSDDDGKDAPTAAAVDGDFSDEQLLAIEKKKEAKSLGKAVYKRWKKLQKKQGGKSKSKKESKKESKKSRKSSEKKKDEGKSKKSSKKERSSKKRARSEDDEDAASVDGFGDGAVGDADDAFAANEAEFAALTQAAASRVSRLGSGVTRIKPAAKKGLTAEQRFAQVTQTAKNLVEEMQKAQLKDELALEARGAAKAPPLNRIAIKDKVQAMCTQQQLIGPLVGAGILQELSHWLYDLNRGEPAPFELRSVALDILLKIPIEGEVADPQSGKGGGRNSIDLNAFQGLSRDELRPTNLGRAVNALRQHQQETSGNRSKCVRLLERLSNAYTGRSQAASTPTSVRGGEGAGGVAMWKCKGDPTVRSPFDVVVTGSQSFQQAFMKPDPQDPTSYNNLLPWRPPVRSITNLSGNLGK